MRDVGTFRAVALADIVNRQFDGHPFAARQGIAQAEQQGAGSHDLLKLYKGLPEDSRKRLDSGASWRNRRPSRHGRRCCGPALAGRTSGFTAGGGQGSRTWGTRSRCIAPRARRRRGSRRRAGASPGSGSMPNSRGRSPHGQSVLVRRRAGRRQRRRGDGRGGAKPAGRAGAADRVRQLSRRGRSGRGGAIRAKAAAGFQMAASGRAAAVVRRALAGAGARGGRRRRGGGSTMSSSYTWRVARDDGRLAVWACGTRVTPYWVLLAAGGTSGQLGAGDVRRSGSDWARWAAKVERAICRGTGGSGASGGARGSVGRLQRMRGVQ